MKLWQNLGKKELQDLIGGNIIVQLESILPALEDGAQNDPTKIFNKNNLVKIVEAFQGANVCKSSELLGYVLNFVKDDALTLLLSQNFINVGNLSFDEKKRFIVDRFFHDHEFALKFLK